MSSGCEGLAVRWMRSCHQMGALPWGFPGAGVRSMPTVHHGCSAVVYVPVRNSDLLGLGAAEVQQDTQGIEPQPFKG